MDKKMVIVLAGAILVSASGGFAAGYFLRTAGLAGGSGFPGSGRQFGVPGQGDQNQARRAGANNFGSARGTIISKDEASITLKLNDGGSANVFYSGATRIVKSNDASADDLNQDLEISAMGTKNSDGSITAQSIQIGGGVFGGPSGMGGRGGINASAANEGGKQ